MLRNLFLKSLNKYASKWVVLSIDILLVSLSFIFAYFIRFNTSFDFDVENLFNQLPVIVIVCALIDDLIFYLSAKFLCGDEVLSNIIT